MQITVDYKLLAISAEEKGSLEHQLQNLAEKSKGSETLFVNAVFMVEGHEYNQMKKRVSAFADSFSSITYTPAILGNSEKIRNFARFILNQYEIQKNVEYLFVGHGSKNSENLPYSELQKVFVDSGFSNVKVAVLKGSGNLEDYLKILKDGKNDGKIEAYPLLINVGEHIKKDVAEFCQSVRENGFEVDYHPFPLSQSSKFKEFFLSF